MGTKEATRAPPGGSERAFESWEASRSMMSGEEWERVGSANPGHITDVQVTVCRQCRSVKSLHDGG